MTAVALRPASCAVCGTQGGSEEIYPANFEADSFSPATFSARRLPDRLHYRIVRCRACGLVRSDPVADPETAAALYRASTFDYAQEVPNLVRTYGRYLSKLRAYHAPLESLLEIGCGNGFFLEHALARGYRHVRGVEPSEMAISLAAPAVRGRIVCDVLRAGLFNERFDVVCAFQVLDHVFDPAGFLALCRELLNPGGLLLCLHHNVEALSARLLGERSPIIDLEHTFLYSARTLRTLLARCGFEVRRLAPAFNTYSLGYLVRLLPAPDRVRGGALALLERSCLSRILLRVPLGNLYAIAQKPEGA